MDVKRFGLVLVLAGLLMLALTASAAAAGQLPAIGSLDPPTPPAPNANDGSPAGVAPLAPAATTARVGAAYTYQGVLRLGGAPVNGACDLVFTHYDDVTAGAVVAGPQTKAGVVVQNGLFTTQINLASPPVDGRGLWLEIQVRCPAGGGAYTTLTPRQAITPAPYALNIRPGASGIDTQTNWNIFYAENQATTSYSYGLRSLANSPQGRGVSGESYGTGGMGVYGFARSSGGAGVAGYVGSSNLDVNTFGTTPYGVFGKSQLEAGTGVYATAPRNASVGVATAGSGIGTGLFGQAAWWAGGPGVQAAGVRGLTGAGAIEDTHPSGIYYPGGGEFSGPNGVIGASKVASGHGVVGLSASGAALYGLAQGSTGVNYGVYAMTSSPSGYAGYFIGNVYVSGTLTKSAGSFKIDDPLDPANKYLYHSFVESPDMKNVYDGVVVLDEKGEASVELPAYFEALNRDFRYQLTCIGGYAPVYVAEEIHANQFRIAGGTPGLKVSWQVTGIRQDAYAEANRIPVEQDKPADERGTYLHPELFGQPASAGVNAQNAQGR